MATGFYGVGAQRAGKLLCAMTTTTTLRLPFPPPAAVAGTILALTAALAATPAAAQVAVQPAACPGGPLVTTAGAAEVAIPADGAEVTIRVEALRPTPTAASTAMTERIEGVLAALSAAGGEGRASTGYSLETERNYETGEEIGYRARSGVVLTIADLSRLSPLLEAALAGGATDMSSLRFTAAGEREAYDRALTAAYSQAARDARVLAEAAGARLGALVELTTAPRPSPTLYSEEIVVTAAVPELETPQVTADARVLAQWCLLDGGDG